VYAAPDMASERNPVRRLTPESQPSVTIGLPVPALVPTRSSRRWSRSVRSIIGRRRVINRRATATGGHQPGRSRSVNTRSATGHGAECGRQRAWLLRRILYRELHNLDLSTRRAIWTKPDKQVVYEKRSSRGLPRWSPIQVLTEVDVP